MNVFFYPVPYVSDVVNVYNIHTMYITQYDIELIMLVSPSLISRGNKDIIDPTLSPITTCSRISEFDKNRFSPKSQTLIDYLIQIYN
jgi:hypothetical protein